MVMDLAPGSFALVAASVLDSRGAVIGKAAYSSDGEVAVRGDRISRPRMAEAIVVDIPKWDQTIRMRLVDPQNPAERLRSKAFDLDELMEAYDIEEVRLPPGLEKAVGAEDGAAPKEADGAVKGGPTANDQEPTP